MHGHVNVKFSELNFYITFATSKYPSNWPRSKVSSKYLCSDILLR